MIWPRLRAEPALPAPPPAPPTPLVPLARDYEVDAKLAEAVERARRRVRDQRDELAAILDSSFDAFVAVDEELRVVHWNARAEQLFGWTEGEAMGTTLLGDVLGPLGPGDLWVLAAGAAGEDPLGLEAYHRSGRRLAVEVALSITDAFDDTGGKRLQAFIRDVSRRERAELRARVEHAVTRAVAETRTTEEAAQQVLRALEDQFGACAGAVWLVDDEARVLKLLETCTGEAAELKAWAAACEVTKLPREGNLPGRAWETGTPVVNTVTASLEGDPRRGVAATAGLRSCLCLPLVVEGTVVGVMELCDAVVQRIDPDLIEHMHGVEQIFSNYLARRKAEAAAEQARTEFLALVSHELRTPLTSIRGYVQMLSGVLPDDADRARQCADVVARNSERLQRLVGDLLLAAEVGRGEMGLEVGTLSLREVVGQALEAAWPVASGRGVRLSLRVDGDPPVIQGDAHRLGQVLDNLLTNAIKFSHEGGRVSIEMEVHGEEIVVAVADEGIGVPAAELERLTERFYRASSAREAQVQGLGLGLSLSVAIVEAHGGRLAIDSVEGKGTTVTIRLPAGGIVPD